jgi:lipopolysaccharide/colanic/teichoic acid biosynthesis glycosyltransferase
MSHRLLEHESREGGLLRASRLRVAFSQSFYVRQGKRALDLVSSALGLIALSPLFILVSCCIKLTTRGPVFYRQVRLGKDGRKFRILKFRSMTMQTSSGELRITIAGDSRVTPVGRFIRRYKVDELPQLWNVIRGDMSLVGPRPEVPAFIAEYTPEERIVLSVRPGITDPASLAYRHEEEILAGQPDPEQFYRTTILPDKLARNRAYLEEITLQSDIRIIVKTILSSFCLQKRQERDARSR